MNELDPRLNAFRPDLADARLQGRVNAPRCADPAAAQCVTAVADLRRAPRPDSPVDTQILYGETVDVFETGRLVLGSGAQRPLCRLCRGRRAHVAHQTPTHIITAPRTFLYPGPDMKLPAEAALSIGSRVAVTGQAETRGTHYLTLANGGAVIAAHAAPLGHFTDPVSIAERLIETPYCGAAAPAMALTVPALCRWPLRNVRHCTAARHGMQTAHAGRALEEARSLSAATSSSGRAMSR